MTLVTNFKRDENGKYAFMKQCLDGADIPEGSTFVAFDSVQFARSTGQIAITDLNCGMVNEGCKLINVENTDGRWDMLANMDRGNIKTIYYGLGPAMVRAFIERGVNVPVLSADCLRVTQHVDMIRGSDYIGDGPMDLTSSNRYNSGMPVPSLTDVTTTSSGGYITGMRISAGRTNY